MEGILQTLLQIDSWVVVVALIFTQNDKIPMPLTGENELIVRFALCLGTYEQDPCNILKNLVVAGRVVGQPPVLPDDDFVKAKPPLWMHMLEFIL